MNKNKKLKKNFIKRYRIAKKRKKKSQIFNRIFSTIIKIWYLKKKLTMITFLWFLLQFGYIVGNRDKNQQISISKEEISRLQKNLKTIPNLESQIKDQEIEVEKLENKLKEKQINNEQIQSEYLTLSEKLIKKDKKIEVLEKKINDLQNSKKQIDNNVKKKLYQKNLEISIFKNDLKNQINKFEDSEKRVQLLESEILFLRNDLNDLQTKTQEFQIQAKKDCQLIEQLKDQLQKKEDELKYYQQELLKMQEKLLNKLDKIKTDQLIQRVVFWIGNHLLNLKKN